MLPIPSDIGPLPKDIGIINFILIDLIFVIGIIVLIVQRRKVFCEDNDILDKKCSKKIKGLLSVLIVIHHLSLYIRYTFLFKIFSTVGIIVVAAFFFYSGYGLMNSYLNNDNYLEKFFKKRVMKLLLPYILALTVTFFTFLLTKYKLTPKEIFNSFFDGEPVVRFSWYVQVILYFYILFYVAAKLFKNKVKINVVIFAGTIFYCLFATKYLSMGNWWVNSCFSFFAGIYWTSYKDKYSVINKNIKKVVCYLIIVSFVSVIILGVQFLTSGYTIHDFFQYNELADCVMKKPVSIVFMNILCVSLMIIMFCILRKVKLNDKVFNFLGKISFELYLYHGIIMYLLRNKYCYLKYDFIYAVLVIGLSILLATLMNIIDQKMYSIINVFRRTEKKNLKRV